MLRRTRFENCLSDLRLDQLVAAELNLHEEQLARGHLEGCSACKARLATIEKEKAEFAANAPSLPLVKSSPKDVPNTVAVQTLSKKARVRTVVPIATALLAAAALVMLVSSGALQRALSHTKTAGTEPSVAFDNTRLKGGNRIGFYVARGGVAVPGGSGDVVAPGDRLQFSYSSPSDGYFALLSVDGARKVSVYFPSDGTAAPIHAGVEVSLPSSVILDSTLGKETIYGLFCASPVALGPLRASLQATPERAPTAAGCQIDRLEIDKRAPR